ncbi:predicted protein [Micromonas commoda]|uniref:Methyltransferase FkbM domain-containing protein n=1 Tax=Micromonas commoda (strain RCC299 / NOUM17 / CCMP2709) TaxID=296587 RepID=C1EJP3_MICCC|nr:predicted protein [Micromonas commoda]ACO68224.1 predicted protein [Micromonas commoda]|eukprot:XP_002506966.1 predicted protein [Micromonas commoda]
MKLPDLRVPNVRLKARLAIYGAVCCSLILFLFFLGKKTTSKADRLQAEYITGKSPLDDLRPASRSVLFPEEEIARMRVTQYEDPLGKHWEGPGAEHIELFHSILSANPGGLYLDVGANEGVLMRLAAMMGHPTIGVEAIAQNYVSLLNMIEENQYATNVRVVHAAASDRSGTMVAFSENHSGKQRNGQQLVKGQSSEFPIQYSPTVALDDIVASKVCLMKLDVEGTEYNALRGAKSLVTLRKIRFVHFEFSPSNMASLSGTTAPKDMLLYLLENGYKLYVESVSKQNMDDVVVHELPQLRQSETGAAFFNRLSTNEFRGSDQREVLSGDVDDFVDMFISRSTNRSLLVNFLAVLN